ncbi:acetyl/propionyl/methylcrotonyl-CoA carboxylase subunit alpha [Microbacterium mitrae]|uniref:biotin carboxylase n=1 Tax=Microbacterium mitrae TaxID=664640 RepID=A0A5C8HNF2_9MICO|nr:biotin carboxylase N-terminal domain-containing protein [Microbacterium mitrae]TXK05606.1 acetyl/propionyl-CoA carboxylase subunit alpha [Microbacterium mitrae]
MFRTVLVANRGEIARRVLRTLRQEGIRSVAVYSDADADAPFVAEADVAVRIGPAAARDSYLNIEAVIAAAIETGAEAIHPGYGFLSENVAFAEACERAGIVFIGPSTDALTVMADKITAKNHVAEHGVPVVPGFSAVGMDDEAIAARCAEVGFPLLIKPSAGGGGKGMQVVEAPADVLEALATARRIASASFGDDTLLIERLVVRPRHIEVQVLGDNFGSVVHLGERECTLQRRHQKVIEEAPSAVITPEMRERLGAAAVAAAQSVNYRGAGTVEFLASGDDVSEFFFIEMNTRLQVEHPVTELVTGVDLVREQLRIAAGLPLDFTQDEVTITGHAIEARVYAESPERGFLPATGTIVRFTPSARARNDSAIESGSTISSDYDPMIAKVITAGRTREEALTSLISALQETVVFGVETNIEFLISLLARDEVRGATFDTGLLDRLGTPERVPTAPELITAAADAMVRPPENGTWGARDGWRSAGPAAVIVSHFLDGDEVVSGTADDGNAAAQASFAVDTDGGLWVHAGAQTRRLVPLSRRALLERHLASLEEAEHPSDPQARAPMPGNVVALHVADGDTVAVGDRLVTIEAMKMEHPVVATAAGIVTIDVAMGEHVRRDQPLAHITAPTTDSAPTTDAGETDA